MVRLEGRRRVPCGQAILKLLWGHTVPESPRGRFVWETELEASHWGHRAGPVGPSLIVLLGKPDPRF